MDNLPRDSDSHERDDAVLETAGAHSTIDRGSLVPCFTLHIWSLNQHFLPSASCGHTKFKMETSCIMSFSWRLQGCLTGIDKITPSNVTFFKETELMIPHGLYYSKITLKSSEGAKLL